MKYLTVTMLLAGFFFNSFATEIFIEDFEADFPSWKSGWLGVNSNLHNYYVVKNDNFYYEYSRGNNPDGIWVDDGDNNHYSKDSVTIGFTNDFGVDILNLSIDIAAFILEDFLVWDNDNTIIYRTMAEINNGAITDPGTYQHISVSSINGISAFGFISGCGSAVEGNTSIDNVVVTKGNLPVPEPGVLPLLGFSLLSFLFKPRKPRL